MRLLKLVGVLSLVVILTTGCYRSDSMENNPINLFDQLPIYNKEKKDISEEVKKISGSANLILPYNSTEVGKINQVDLDKDGKEEVIFFKSKEDIKNEVGFTILDSKNEFYDVSYTEQGDKIKYANFYDIDKDGNKEIILVIEENNEDTLTICRYEDEKINAIISKNNYDYFNQNKYSKLNVLINDINNDNELEVIVYNYSFSKKQMGLSVCKLENDTISVLDTLNFDNVKNFDDINISIGKISKKEKALFLSLPSSKKSTYITKLVYFNQNKLVDALKKFKTISNDYYIAFEDVNNDGITNIPQIEENSINIDTLSTSTYPKSMIVNWNKYNEKNKKETSLIFVSQIYYNYEMQFKFLIPNNWAQKISISESSDTKNNNYKTFNFYYDDSSKLNLKKNENKKLLFSLNLMEKNIVEDTKNINKTSENNVFENDKYVFSISNINKIKLKNLNIDNINILKEYFSEIK